MFFEDPGLFTPLKERLQEKQAKRNPDLKLQIGALN